MNLGTGSYEFRYGNVKISYILDDGKITSIAKHIIDITDDKEIIIITNITSNNWYETTTEIFIKAFEEFKKVNNKIIVGSVDSINAFNVKDEMYTSLGLCDISPLCDGSCIRVYILPEGKGKFIKSYCEAKRYLDNTDFDLFPICWLHAKNIAKGGYLNGSVTSAATELNNMIDQTIHDFNTRYSSVYAFRKETKTICPIRIEDRK